MDGLLFLDKPIAWTSHDLVDAVRRKTGLRAVGHAGTLDPMATGLMIMLLGKATKRSAELTGMDKTYRGSIRLGMITNSWDMDGKILDETLVPEFRKEEVKKRMDSLTGEQHLEPPIFSAIKRGGVRAHSLARRGEAVETEPRLMRIDRFELEAFESPEIYFAMDCSKGTYVRSLAYALGTKLGCGAALSSLVRTRIGEFHLKDALDHDSFLDSPLELIERRLK